MLISCTHVEASAADLRHQLCKLIDEIGSVMVVDQIINVVR